jgi:hypothetical protein
MVLMFSSCLKEEPPFLSEESAYDNIGNARATLGGVYQAVAQHNYYGYDFLYLSYGNSGFYVSGIHNSNQAQDNLFLCSLKPQPSATYTENTWDRIYQAINRANSFIKYVPEVTDSVNNPEMAEWNDLLGEAYFLRAFSYFNLVRLWGEVPLRLEPTNMDNIHMAKSSTVEIYSQILSDVAMAKRLMYHVDKQRLGYPASEAASMLEAKVYMQMATTDDDVPQTGANYWQKAYDAAKEVYGKYSFVSDYKLLWDAEKGNNTSESIFELQYNEVAHSNYVRLFTASKAIKGNTWGRLRMNAELIDSHMAAYPNDSIRLTGTYVTGFVKQNTGKYTKVYPETTKRDKFANAFNYLYKYWEKDVNKLTSYNNQNFKVYRYADLLLMLAEISNELQNGEEMTYLKEVLDRVGVSPRPEYSNGQAEFRKAIMYEYRYELLGEGHDWFNNRRRGYDWFKNEVIDPHNNYALFNSDVDVTLETSKDIVMHVPIPSSEINRNDLISN